MNEPHFEARNNALLQDEMLMQVVQVLEGGYPLGPSFMHGLGSVIEAAVLHERNYFDVNASFGDPNSPGLQTALRTSTFLQQLHTAGALRTFPPPDEVDAVLEQVGADEDMLGFVAEFNWTGGGAAFTDIDFETRHWRCWHACSTAIPRFSASWT